MASKRVLDTIKTLSEYTVKSKGYGQFMKNVELTDAGDGKCQAEFTVAQEHLNALGTLHGGCISTIIDCISTYALMAKGPEVSAGGVSVDLHVTFLKAALPGEVIKVDAKTIRAGRTLAFLEVELSKKKDGVIIARGQHTKYIGTTK